MTRLRAADWLVYEFEICTGTITDSRGPPVDRTHYWQPVINNWFN